MAAESTTFGQSQTQYARQATQARSSEPAAVALAAQFRNRIATLREMVDRISAAVDRIHGPRPRDAEPPRDNNADRPASSLIDGMNGMIAELERIGERLRNEIDALERFI